MSNTGLSDSTDNWIVKKVRKDENTRRVFFELVKAGLFGHTDSTECTDYSCVDWGVVYRLAEQQSVIGLIADAIDRFKLQVPGFTIPQERALQFIGQTLQVEQRNKAMNEFLAATTDKLRKEGVYTLVVKGQGIAQCYERSLWRSSGDIDFLLSEDNFVKAREILRPLTENGFDPSDEDARHISARIGQWDIELHGNQYCGLSSRIDRVIESVQRDIFIGGKVRSTEFNSSNGSLQADRTRSSARGQVFLPAPDEDVIIVFTHFLKHFYKGGLGLRQICDWCRLLYTYRESLNQGLLESRLRKAWLMSEWNAFAAYAVDFLGMPVEAMPLYSDSVKWSRKARQINRFVMSVGNMGHNRDNRFYGSKSFLVRKIGAFSRRIGDLCRHALIFPLDSLRFMPSIVFNGLRSAAKGVG